MRELRELLLKNLLGHVKHDVPTLPRKEHKLCPNFERQPSLEGAVKSSQ